MSSALRSAKRKIKKSESKTPVSKKRLVATDEGQKFFTSLRDIVDYLDCDFTDHRYLRDDLVIYFDDEFLFGSNRKISCFPQFGNIIGKWVIVKYDESKATTDFVSDREFVSFNDKDVQYIDSLKILISELTEEEFEAYRDEVLAEGFKIETF